MKSKWTVLPAAIGMIVLCAVPYGAAAQDVCITDALEAKVEREFIENQFTGRDRGWLRKLGLPDTILGVRWVTDPSACAEAVVHLRAQGDSLKPSTSTKVLLFQVDPGLYVVVGDADLNTINFFDRGWRYITS